jgi:hypothetical protein
MMGNVENPDSTNPGAPLRGITASIVGIMRKCPKPKCPPTDFPLMRVTSMGEMADQSVCGGTCGATYLTGLRQYVAE